MKHVPAVSIVLLFGSMTGIAQGFGVDGPQRVVLEAAPTSFSCPIGIRVKQGLGDQLLEAKGDQPAGIAQYLQVTMSNLGSVDVVGAQITAHGYAAQTRYLPASASTVSSQITKTVNIKLTVKSKENAYSDVRLPSFSAVRFIDLESVTFADGSAWHSSPGKTCYAVPDLMRLVSTGR